MTLMSKYKVTKEIVKNVSTPFDDGVIFT